MKYILPRTKKNSSGFTLVELLIVISIIAVLATIGFAIYSGLNTGPKSRNIVRKTDLDSIEKALEVNKAANVNYALLANTQFANGAIPTDPTTNNVYCANFAASTQPADPAAWTTACPAAGVTWGTVGTAYPPAGTSWKICAWLEDEDGTGPGVAKAFCKLSAQ